MIGAGAGLGEVPRTLQQLERLRHVPALVAGEAHHQLVHLQDGRQIGGEDAARPQHISSGFEQLPWLRDVRNDAVHLIVAQAVRVGVAEDDAVVRCVRRQVRDVPPCGLDDFLADLVCDDRAVWARRRGGGPLKRRPSRARPL